MADDSIFSWNASREFDSLQSMDTVVPETPTDWVYGEENGGLLPFDCVKAGGLPLVVGGDGAAGIPPVEDQNGVEGADPPAGFDRATTIPLLPDWPFDWSPPESSVTPFDGSETESPSKPLFGFEAVDESETQPPSQAFDWSETQPPSPAVDGSETQQPSQAVEGSETQHRSHAVNWWDSELPSIGLDDIAEGSGCTKPPAVESKRVYTDSEKTMLLILMPGLKDLI